MPPPEAPSPGPGTDASESNAAHTAAEPGQPPPTNPAPTSGVAAASSPVPTKPTPTARPSASGSVEEKENAKRVWSKQHLDLPYAINHDPNGKSIDCATCKYSKKTKNGGTVNMRRPYTVDKWNTHINSVGSAPKKRGKKEAKGGANKGASESAKRPAEESSKLPAIRPLSESAKATAKDAPNPPAKRKSSCSGAFNSPKGNRDRRNDVQVVSLYDCTENGTHTSLDSPQCKSLCRNNGSGKPSSPFASARFPEGFQSRERKGTSKMIKEQSTRRKKKCPIHLIALLFISAVSVAHNVFAHAIFAHRSVLNSATAEQKDEDRERKGGTSSPGFVSPENLRNVEARPRRKVSSSVLMTGVSPSNPDSRPLKFEVENLNLSIPAYCGEQKCFFRGKGNPPRFGYLLQQRDPEGDLAKGQKSSLLARRIEREYDAPTLFGPVQLVYLTDNDATRLNVNLIKESHQRKLSESKNYVRGKAVVYTVRMAAQPSLLMGTTEIRIKHAVSHLQEVLAASSDKASFLGNLRRGAEKAVALVWKVPCLAGDFQVILDALGRLWHIDFDRCFRFDTEGKKVYQHGGNKTYTQEQIDGFIKPSLDVYVKTAEQIIAAMNDSNRG